MATAAVSSKFTIVDVVAGVAITATSAQRRLDFQRLPVAGFAAYGTVRTVQAETRLCIVVEAPFTPINGCMAGCTVLAEAALVRLVFAMAGVAVLGGISKNFLFMARRALRIRVLAEQWEARQVMIEEHVLAPGLVIVAVIAR